MENNKDIEIEYQDVEGLTIFFWDKGTSLMLLNEEAKELRDILIEALSV